jgi:tetratricopeptide (TPR) repeat protein
MRQDAKVTLFIVGPLRLLGRDGSDRTPRSRKACALMALMALAPDNRRARKWLQDKLWSDRGEEQGAQSLRQTLSEIRRALGPDRDCLRADGALIALDRNQILISTAPNAVTADNGFGEDEFVLLEGLDAIRDPEFENWLRDQRAHFESVAKINRLQQDTDDTALPPEATGANEAERSPRFQLILEEPREVESPRDIVIANALTDVIAKTISEIGTIDVLDRRAGFSGAHGQVTNQLATAISVQSGIVHDGEGATWRVLLAETASKQMIWSVTAQQRNTASLKLDDATVLRELNRIVDIAINRFVTSAHSQEGQTAATMLCHQAVQHLAKLKYNDFMIADKLFERAYELEPRGLYLGWRGYLRIFILIESRLHEHQQLVEEATDFINRALEKEPLNSYVASFAAHVHAFMRRSYVAAYEFAQRSVQLNRANALGWACLGIAECHLGKTQAGFKHALMAREIAGTIPVRFQIDGLSCVASAMAGDLDQAIFCAEASHALSPRFALALRYMSALYLIQNDQNRSLGAVRQLQQLEPDFSYEKLRETSYPVAGLHRARLLQVLPSREV